MSVNDPSSGRTHPEDMHLQYCGIDSGGVRVRAVVAFDEPEIHDLQHVRDLRERVVALTGLTEIILMARVRTPPSELGAAERTR
jgi:hypothetical protein